MKISRLLNVVLPPRRCVVCGARSADHGICLHCRHDLPLNTPACPRCAAHLQAVAADCRHCREHPPPWAAAWAPLRFSFPADTLVRDLKFSGRLANGRALGELLGALLPAAAAPATATLVPVPLHVGRQYWRGFNQASEIARPLARLAGMSLADDWVRRQRATRQQSGLDAAARARNLRGAFSLTRRGKTALPGRSVIVVDDVLTTGATCSALATTLLRGGAREVRVWCCARAERA